MGGGVPGAKMSIDVDANSGMVQYNGSWTILRSDMRTDPQDLRTTTMNGSTATFSFRGSSIKVIGTVFPSNDPPKAIFMLNGTQASASVEPYTQQALNGQQLFAADSLGEGRTEITVTVITNGSTFSLDGFSYTPNDLDDFHTKEVMGAMRSGSQNNSFNKSEINSMRTAAIVGAILGGLLLAGLIIGGFFLFRCLRERRKIRTRRCPPGRTNMPCMEDDDENKYYSSASCRHLHSHVSFDPSWVAGAIPTFTSLADKVVVDMGYSPPQSNVAPSPAFATRSVAEQSVSVSSLRPSRTSRVDLPALLPASHPKLSS